MSSASHGSDACGLIVHDLWQAMHTHTVYAVCTFREIQICLYIKAQHCSQDKSIRELIHHVKGRCSFGCSFGGGNKTPKRMGDSLHSCSRYQHNHIIISSTPAGRGPRGIRDHSSTTLNDAFCTLLVLRLSRFSEADKKTARHSPRSRGTPGGDRRRLWLLHTS